MSVLKQALLCLVLVAGAAAGWYVYQNPQMVGLAGESEAAGQPRRGGGIPGLLGSGGAVNVVTAPVQTDSGGDTLTALGSAKAVRSITLYPEVTGMVTEVLFRPGQTVEEGAVLVRLESREQQVAIDRAKVALDQAHAALERSQRLAKSKTIAAVALSDSETAVRMAEIEVRTAEIGNSRRSIVAPFAGVTGMTDLSVGDLVTSSAAVTTLDDLSRVRVAFEVPERRAAQIRPDQPIVAAAQGLPGSRLSGRIVAIDSRVDATTRTLRLEAELDNEGGALKTGMAVAVTLDFATDAQLAVPTLSVQWDRAGSFVWKIVDGAARRAAVDIIRRQSGVVLVGGDLAAGDTVVVEGIQRLREGAKIADVGVSPALVGAPPAVPAAEPSVSAGEPAKARG